MDPEDVVARVNDPIAERPGRVVVVFLAVTLVFGLGLGSITTESGTQQFTEDVPANRALERVEREFGPRFGSDLGSTQLIQRGQNVLARRSLLAMLRAQKRLADRPGMRVTETSSAARVVARTLDPNATTLAEQIDAVEGATPGEIDRAVRANADNPAFTRTLSEDFDAESASASATVGVVRHRIPGGISATAGAGGDSPLTPIQIRASHVVATVDGDVTVFGQGTVSREFSRVITDSLLIVTPAAVVFIVFFLVLAYRDPADLLLGVVSLLMAVVWTFGFLGLAGIPFNMIMISIPPLLLAVGIDFGIHAVNDDREALEAGETVGGDIDDREAPEAGETTTVGPDDSAGDPGPTMRVATRQLLVAFFIVTGTTVIGFMANYASDLGPIRDFGVVAAIGIVFTFLIFGVFLPSAKVLLDRYRERYPIPTVSETPLGAEGTSSGRVLRVGVVVADRVPVGFLLAVLVLSAGAGYYATGIDTSFTQEDFLPPEETPDYLAGLPEPFAPGDYTVAATLEFLEEEFASSRSSTVTVYVQRPMTEDTALESIHRAGRDPPASFVAEDRRASSTSLVTVIRSWAARDPAFRRLVARNDVDGNGIPDRNLGEVYDYLLSSPARERTLQYLSRDRRSTRVVYRVKTDATNDRVVADAKAVADRHRGTATATGRVVVFEAISTLIFESAVTSLTVAMVATVVFLVAIYGLLEGRPSLGVANAVPIVVAVTAIAASMRALGVSFNAVTATVLAITIGLGVDYSVHVTHRFVDERRANGLYEALDRTVRGTGGALAGSMLTTVSGVGVLVLAVLSVIGQFGLVTGLSIAYSFLASLLVLPSVLVVWDRLVGNDPAEPM